MADHVALVDAERRSHGVLCCLRILNGRPRRHLAIAELRHCHRRLHRRVRVVRDVVSGLDDPAAFGELGVDVATAAGDLAWLLHGSRAAPLVGRESYAPCGPSSHSSFNCLRPWKAAHVLSAITATPPSGWNMIGGFHASSVTT